METRRVIRLKGVEVHNLKRVDLEIPHRNLVVLCGLSGSGKSSLAFDTLYAEGQRRYIESFSAYTRQFLERLEKPAAESIEGIPPAIAVVSQGANRSSRATVGAATEINDYLRLLWANLGTLVCPGCGQQVQSHSATSAVASLNNLPTGTRLMICFAADGTEPTPSDERLAALVEAGFVRAVVGGRVVRLDELTAAGPRTGETDVEPALVVVDRVTIGPDTGRLTDSVELALAQGVGQCVALYEAPSDQTTLDDGETVRQLDGQPWRQREFCRERHCLRCRRDFPAPEPRLFNFNSPLGACPRCEGFGSLSEIDMQLVVPDPAKSLREGAVAPWNTPAYAHELEELLALADDYHLPVDAPFSQLNEAQLRIVRHGVPERKFGGLDGFFAWLEKRKYKMHLRVFLSRWRSYRECPDCRGARLRPDALAVQVGQQNIAQVQQSSVAAAREFFENLTLTAWQAAVSKAALEQVGARLAFLEAVGLHYLSLDRPLRTLSTGEAQRVALTSALGASLVNVLYVLDEPSVGLHPRDTQRLVQCVLSLRDRGNSVVVVEHDEALIRAADQVIEIGPGAGEQGGKIVFQGTPAEMIVSPQSLTGDYLAGRRRIRASTRRRQPSHGWIRLAGARGNNLQNLSVEIPLGMLCVVTGVSGAGKSTLIQDTLYPALCRRVRKEAIEAAPYDDVFGDGQLEDVVLVDQSPIGRSPRSNPVTYIRAFDEIRQVFAETLDARTRNYTAGHFSFNVEGGRCNACDGDGHVQVDMQFLADVFMKCAQCGGTRYRAEILDVEYRGRNIADVLEMTVREAFLYFRGHPKVQARLKRLIDVGLDYVRLGQPANTLSGGEAQRLKLAGYLTAAKRGRCLFILDEPTTGLHFADVVQLIDCFEALVSVGHSLIVVEHNVGVMKCADYLIDLGPGAAEQGGRIVAQGTPEIVARCKESATARFLAAALAEDAQEQTA